MPNWIFKMIKQATQTKAEENAQEQDKQVQGDMFKDVMDIDEDELKQEADTQQAGIEEALGFKKEAAYNLGDTEAETVKLDYKLEISGLSDYNLAEMLAESETHDRQSTTLNFNEEKEKQLKSVKSDRYAAETKVFNIVKDHTLDDWKKAFQNISDYEHKVATEEELRGKDWKKGDWRTNDKDFKAVSDDDKEKDMDGVGGEEEKGQVGKEASKKKALYGDPSPDTGGGEHREERSSVPNYKKEDLPKHVFEDSSAENVVDPDANFDERSPEALGESFVNGNISYVRELINNDVKLFNSILYWLEEASPQSVESFRRLMTASKKKADENLEQEVELDLPAQEVKDLPEENVTPLEPTLDIELEKPKEKVDDKITQKIDEKVEEKTEEIVEKIEEKIEEHAEEMAEKVETKIEEKIEEAFEEHHEDDHDNDNVLPTGLSDSHEDEETEDPIDLKDDKDNDDNDKKEEDEEDEIPTVASKKETLKKIAEISSPWKIVTDEHGVESIARVAPKNTKESKDDDENDKVSKDLN